MNFEQALQSCQAVSPRLVKLPAVQLDRKVYMQLANALEAAGGKWNRREDGFVFEGKADRLLELLKDKDKPNPNIKKEYQFFETPKIVAKRMAKLLRLEHGDKVLEPSAGRGALIEAVRYWYPDKAVDGYELMDLNREALKQIKGFRLLGEDFMDCREYETYDKIIANPPFTKKQDIQHILKMWSCLAKGGRIVTLAMPSYETAQDAVSKNFREFINRYAVYTELLEAGTFKQSGTIAVRLIVLYKPKNFAYEGQTVEVEVG